MTGAKVVKTQKIKKFLGGYYEYNELIGLIENKLGKIHNYRLLKDFLNKITPKNDFTEEEIKETLILFNDDLECRFNKKGYFNIVNTYIKVSYSFDYRTDKMYLYDFKRKTTEEVEISPFKYYIFLNKEWFKK